MNEQAIDKIADVVTDLAEASARSSNLQDIRAMDAAYFLILTLKQEIESLEGRH